MSIQDDKRKQFSDLYTSLYQDIGEGDSREMLYITLTNLAKLRIVRSVLHDVLVMDDDPFIDRDSWVAMNRQVYGWIQAIEQALDTDGDADQNGSGECWTHD